MDSTKTIDIASLPMAESVNGDDTLLLMRQGESGENKLMRVEKGTLTAAPQKKRVKRYVIGRAIAPGSLDDSGHENWYCFGTRVDSAGDRWLVINIATSKKLTLDINGVTVALKYGEPSSVAILGSSTENSYTRLYYHVDAGHFPNARVFAFKVIGYSKLDDDMAKLYLTMAEAPHTLSSESTHHSFVNGNRQWVGNYLKSDRIKLLIDNEDTRELRLGGPSLTLSFSLVRFIGVKAKKLKTCNVGYYIKALKQMNKNIKKKQRLSERRKNEDYYSYSRNRDSITGTFYLTEFSEWCSRKGRSMWLQIGGVRKDNKTVDNITEKRICLSLKKTSSV